MTVFIPVAPDVELGLMTLLRQQFPTLATPFGGRPRVMTEVPSNLPDRVSGSVPFVRVTDITPRRDGRLEVSPTLDVETWWLGRTKTRNLAVQIEAFLLSYPHRITADGDFMLFDEVIVSMGPQRVDSPYSGVERYYASYQISARR